MKSFLTAIAASFFVLMASDVHADVHASPVEVAHVAHDAHHHAYAQNRGHSIAHATSHQHVSLGSDNHLFCAIQNHGLTGRHHA